MAYNTTASLEKLSCPDYVDFDKDQENFGQIFWSKKDSFYLNVELKNFKKDDNKELRLVQFLTIGEAAFKQFLQLRNQLVIAAEVFGRYENLSLLLTHTISKNLD